MNRKNEKQIVGKRSILIAFSAIFIIVAPFFLREVYPHLSLVGYLLKGPRILIFWVVAAILIYAIDMKTQKKK
jgi:hypothetical protein